MVGVLVIVGGVEDDLRARLGVDVSGRYRLGHCCCDVTSDHFSAAYIRLFRGKVPTHFHNLNTKGQSGIQKECVTCERELFSGKKRDGVFS